jgi:membrane-associated phospholipid phosphatase
LASGLVFLALFAVVTYFVTSGLTQGLDQSGALYINHLDLGPSLGALLILASEYGREYFWIPVVGLMLVLGRRDTKMLAIELAALFVVGVVAGEAMKFAMYRARPFEALPGILVRVPIDTDSSYPSGHAIIVSIGAIFSLVKFRRKASIASLLTLEAALVCFSRVYVGMHYPLDVVSGVFLGGFIVLAGVYVMEGYLGKILKVLAEFSTKVLGRGLASV